MNTQDTDNALVTNISDICFAAFNVPTDADNSMVYTYLTIALDSLAMLIVDDEIRNKVRGIVKPIWEDTKCDVIEDPEDRNIMRKRRLRESWSILHDLDLELRGVEGPD